MQGYHAESYGDGFADVYDEWYEDPAETTVAVEALIALASGGPVLELGVGTGRLAIPLSKHVTVHGIDTSAAMLDRLRAKDRDGGVVVHRGDMAEHLPDGPFSLVVASYNTLFNLLDQTAQRRCFAEVAARLVGGGRFVVEAFVPAHRPRPSSDVSVRSISSDRVVLSVSVDRPAEQLAEGHFVELAHDGGVRLRPWSIRYLTPGQLDDMATAAGLVLEHRWGSFGGEPFDAHGSRHVSVYQRSTTDPGHVRASGVNPVLS